MKRYIIVSLILACICFANVELSFTNLSSHKGDIWTGGILTRNNLGGHRHF